VLVTLFSQNHIVASHHSGGIDFPQAHRADALRSGKQYLTTHAISFEPSRRF
jgi:hypothetical protein